MKAYIVTDDEDYEPLAVVVFAASDDAAIRKGAAELGLEQESVSCQEATELNRYAPGPVPPLVLIAHGWMFECGGCVERLDQDALEEKPRHLQRGENVYCSPWCRLADVERRGRQVAQENLAARLAALCLPHFCAVVRGMVVADYDPKTRRAKHVLGAEFTFPGAQHGTGTWRADRRDMAMVPQGDYDTYQKLKERETRA